MLGQRSDMTHVHEVRYGEVPLGRGRRGDNSRGGDEWLRSPILASLRLRASCFHIGRAVGVDAQIIGRGCNSPVARL